MSHDTVWACSGGTAVAPSRSAASSLATGSTSATVSLAPSAARWSARAAPTLPTPEMHTWRPLSDGEPHSRSATAFVAHRTPHAVAGDGSPEPPSDSLTPVTNDVSRRITSMSAWVVPTSSAVR
jgi:hypothetical protein